MNSLIKIIFILIISVSNNANAGNTTCEQNRSITRLETLKYSTCLIQNNKTKKALGLRYYITNISPESINIFVEKSNPYRFWFSIWDGKNIIFRYDEDILDNDTYIPRPRVYESKVLKPGETHADELAFKDLVEIVKIDSPRTDLNNEFRLAFFIQPNFLRNNESGNAFDGMMLRKRESRSNTVAETTRLEYSNILIEWE